MSGKLCEAKPKAKKSFLQYRLGRSTDVFGTRKNHVTRKKLFLNRINFLPQIYCVFAISPINWFSSDKSLCSSANKLIAFYDTPFYKFCCILPSSVNVRPQLSVRKYRSAIVVRKCRSANVWQPSV